jgi:hypothetical protein
MATNSKTLTQAEKETLFYEWLASAHGDAPAFALGDDGSGASSSDKQQLFEQLCIEDKEFAERVEQANYLNLLKETSADAEVPNWQDKVNFPFVEKTPWWQWQGMPAASLCCSVAAILMVLSGFNFKVDEGRLSVGFGDSSPNTNIALLIDQKVQEKLDAQQQANQALLAQYVDTIQQQQLQTSTQLTEYLLTSSRTERREDFAELIKFVNQQRYDDQVFYVRQLNELQTEINMQTGAGFDVVRQVSDIRLDE